MSVRTRDPRTTQSSVIRHQAIVQHVGTHLDVFYEAFVSDILPCQNPAGRVSVGDQVEQDLSVGICDYEGRNRHCMMR